VIINEEFYQVLYINFRDVNYPGLKYEKMCRQYLNESGLFGYTIIKYYKFGLSFNPVG